MVLADDKALRDVRKEQVDGIIKSIDNISKRFMSKQERTEMSEILRLQLCKRSIGSNFLDRRIQGMKDLNSVLKSNTGYGASKTFSTEYLLDWLVKNDVFNLIWDHKKTHNQLVQRSDEIFKFLLKEDKLSDELLNMFWSLTKTEMQSDVIKIINDCSYYLKAPQITFFIDEITSQQTDKLSNAEFDLLCDLGNKGSMKRVGDFFW